jgi:glycosyltransferase involved in cell wall biosynthesis
MKKIYFDITDIVEYASGHSRVSGIQRVQVRLISSLARRIGGDRIRACFWHPYKKELVEFDPAAVFDQVEFDSGLFQKRLGLLGVGFFPPRHQIKKYLAPHDNRKIKRGFLKAGVYLTSVFARDRLKSMGIETLAHLRDVSPVPLLPVASMNVDDVYVFIGANWACPEIQDFGRRHKESGGSVFQMIYDLIPYKAPQYCTQSLVPMFLDFLNRAPSYASHFVCISDWTRNDFLEFLVGRGVVRPVSTVPLAHEFDGFARNQSDTNADSAAVAAISPNEFVLCVGTIEIRKNGVNLLKAWGELVRKRNGDVPILVFAGKLGWKLSEFTAVLNADPILRSKVIIFSSPSDKDLAFLYQKSLFSVYPSIYEGWGLPVGEAAWFGKYVIAAKVTSLPEVCGDLMDYVDPYDVHDIAGRIGFALDNPAYVKEKELAIRRASLRSWDDVADMLLNALET